MIDILTISILCGISLCAYFIIQHDFDFAP